MDLFQHMTPAPQMSLRPYQKQAIDSLMAWFAKNDGNPIVVIPTAGGKTVVFGTLIKECLTNWPGVRILVLAHLKELLSQAEKKLLSVWPEAPAGVFAAGLKRREIAPITIGSIHTLWNKADILGKFDLIIVDECHRIPMEGDGRYRKFIAALKQHSPFMRVVGFTATHFRMGKGVITEGKDAIFTDIAYQAHIKDLIEQGYLCPLTSKSGIADARPDLSKVHTQGGEFKQDELEAAVDKDDLIERALDEVMRFCHDRHSWVIFCVSVKHAEKVSQALSVRGIHAPVVHGGTPADIRDELLVAFDRGEIRALCNVNILTEGWDAPRLDAIIMLRPTQSPGLYVQMVGRGFRLHESKVNTLVLDLAGNIDRHGPVDTVRPRAKREGSGVAPVKECPKCQELVHASARICPGLLESGEKCGYEFPFEEKPPHETVASDKPILSGQTYIMDIVVSDVFYCKHEKPGKPPMLKVSYWNGGATTYDEYVCLEHEGWARGKAEKWWAQRAPTLCPPTVDAALEYISWTEKTPAAFTRFDKPKKIVVEMGGDFPRVKQAIFDRRNAA